MSNPDAKVENPETYQKLEQQFILRLPKEISDDIRLSLKTETKLVKKQLKLKMDPETRYGYLIFKGNVVPLKLVDLPTVTESSKTIDGKFLFKTADVHQMMVAYPLEENNNETGACRFQWPHGLAAPLKNVKKSRFRKMLRNKACHNQQLAKEIRRLLKIDSEAVSYRWELIDDTSGKNDSDTMEIIDERDVFGDIGTSISEDEFEELLQEYQVDHVKSSMIRKVFVRLKGKE